jgi:hypothetical protein
MSAFRSERIWRYITDFWTVALMAFFIVNLITQNRYDYLTAPFSIIYTGVLGLYVSTKEFDRWYELHDGRHPGEIFIALWTVVIFTLFVAQMILGSRYQISSEAIADYIMVLSVFALTQKSKHLHQHRRGR